MVVDFRAFILSGAVRLACFKFIYVCDLTLLASLQHRDSELQFAPATPGKGMRRFKWIWDMKMNCNFKIRTFLYFSFFIRCVSCTDQCDNYPAIMLCHQDKLSDWISELQGRSENIEDLVSELELAYNSVEARFNLSASYICYFPDFHFIWA